MNSPEEYENIIALLEEALKFYANKNNYSEGKLPEGEFDFNVCIRPECRIPFPSPVQLDGGSQAQFALEQSKKLVEANRKMQEEYDRFVAAGEMIQASEDIADPEELIKAFKIFGDDKNI